MTKASGREVEMSSNHFHPPETFVSHANALLTPRTRLRLARLIVESGWTRATAAKMFMVSARTARKWADRYRTEGVVGMADRSSRPHHSPNQTPQHVVKQIVALRWRHRLGPVQIAGRLDLPASTVPRNDTAGEEGPGPDVRTRPLPHPGRFDQGVKSSSSSATARTDQTLPSVSRSS